MEQRPGSTDDRGRTETTSTPSSSGRAACAGRGCCRCGPRGVPAAVAQSRRLRSGKGSLRTYLVVLARGVATRFRAQRCPPAQAGFASTPRLTFARSPQSDVVMFEPILQRETAARVQDRARPSLDVRQREAIETSFFEEMRPGDIARRCGIPEGTVKSRVAPRAGAASSGTCRSRRTDGKKKSLLVRTSRSSERFSFHRRRGPIARSPHDRESVPLIATSCGSADAAESRSG